MIPCKHRPAQINVDLSAIESNMKNEISHLKKGQQVWAVVKANGYGHGAVEVAKTAINAGATGLCVAELDEALELRSAKITVPILVLGIIPEKYALIAAENDISLTIGDNDWLKVAENNLAQSNKKLKIHIAIDSGMGRIGYIDDDDFKKANKIIEDSSCFEVEGMFAHFSTADSTNSDYFEYQMKRFNHLKSLLTVKPKYIHVDNTAASIFTKDVPSDIVRFGIGLYGLNPSSTPAGTDMTSDIKLRPAMSLTSELVFVKKIHKGSGVGYGATYKAGKDEWIGTVPVGYADGWQRKMQGFNVKVGDTYCPIIGRVCMDQFMVLLPQRMPVGTKVELISANPNDPNDIKAVADKVGTIHYEVACLLTDRLERKYF